jgi:radical SAM family uncharacterized protein/radical SAM-linked protein
MFKEASIASENEIKDFRGKIFRILKEVNRPSRYIGQETGSVQKKWDDCAVKTCLLFPDMYEVAVSNLGHRILYHLINSMSGEYDFLVDRTYAPANDFREKLKQENLPLYGVDHFKKLSDYDVIAVSLQYELSYPTFLEMLDMGGIKIKNSQRGNDAPIIIAGGPGCYNPESLSEFVDAFIIGDGEDVLPEILEKIAAYKQQSLKREDIINNLAKIEGIYVPSLYEIQNTKNGLVQKKDFAPAYIKKKISNLDIKNVPVNFPVPYSPSVHDRAVVEIRRGCGRMCRFCQACYVNLPVREQDASCVFNLVEDSLSNTGYEEYSLLSLSSNDYTGIENLVKSLNNRHSQSGASVSLPSQRADTFSLELAAEVQKVRKSTLTFAPEAGSQRLRDVINKNLTKEQIFEAVFSSYKSGWSSVKLYFMIGLPTETYEDLDEIVQLLSDLKYQASQIKRELNLKKHLDLTCTISIFVPKPFTPFQWFGQDSLGVLDEKIQYLKGKARYLKGVRLNFHDSFLCQLEAVFARGDHSLNNLIERAWKKGSYLDAWNEHFNKPLWNEAAEELGISFDEYSQRTFSLDEVLPWDYINTGVSKDWLKKEYENALEDQVTVPCDVKCSNCGVCSSSEVKKTMNKSTLSTENEIINNKSGESDLFRYRLKISKLGVLKFISHLDWQGLLYKAVRKSGLKVAFTQGFNPSPKISIGVAMPLFIESEGEYADIELLESIDEKLLTDLLNKNLPEDSRVLSLKSIELTAPSVDKFVEWAEYIGTAEKKYLLKNYDLEGTINNILLANEFIIEKKTKKGFTNKIDIRPSVHAVELYEDNEVLKLKFVIKAGQGSNNQDLVSLRSDDFLKNINDEINWDIKRLKLFDKSFNELL